MTASSDDAERYVRANLDLWNAVTPHHVTSRFYDVEGFKAGRSRRRTGLAELGKGLSHSGTWRRGLIWTQRQVVRP